MHLRLLLNVEPRPTDALSVIPLLASWLPLFVCFVYLPIPRSMTSAVEAKSLSALTTLASNPPRYPRNPTHEGHEPLVLYIERVPGSKGECCRCCCTANSGLLRLC